MNPLLRQSADIPGETGPESTDVGGAVDDIIKLGITKIRRAIIAITFLGASTLGANATTETADKIESALLPFLEVSQTFVPNPVFIESVRDLLGDPTPEIEDALFRLAEDYKSFSTALITGINNSGIDEHDHLSLEFKFKPDMATLGSLFMNAPLEKQIKMIINFQTNGGNVFAAISEEFPHMGESREELERFYTKGFLDRLDIKNANRPDLIDPSVKVTEDAYETLLANTAYYSGIYSAYTFFLLGEEGEGFVPALSEPQFYELLALAHSSFEKGSGGGEKGMARHIGMTGISMLELSTVPSHTEYSRRTGSFLGNIGFEEAARIHSEIGEAYKTFLEIKQLKQELVSVELKVEEVKAEVVKVQAEARDAQAQAERVAESRRKIFAALRLGS